MPYGLNGYDSSNPNGNGTYDTDSSGNNNEENGLEPNPDNSGNTPEITPCKTRTILEGWDESDLLDRLQMRSLNSSLSQKIWEKSYRKYKDIPAIKWMIYLVDRADNYQTGGTFILVKEQKYQGQVCYVKVLEWFEPAQFNSNNEWLENAVNYVKNTATSQSFFMNYYSQKFYSMWPSDGWSFAEQMAKDYIEGTGEFAENNDNSVASPVGTGLGLAFVVFALIGIL